MNGTITWFNCEEVTPPAPYNGGDFTCSDLLLLYNPKNGTGRGRFYIAGKEKDITHYSHDSGNWKPTHWAFLNYPE